MRNMGFKKKKKHPATVGHLGSLVEDEELSKPVSTE